MLKFLPNVLGSKNDKLNNGICTNVQEERGSNSIKDEEEKKQGLFLPVSERIY